MKYLLLLFIFLVSPITLASMDDECFIIIKDIENIGNVLEEKGCVRNNILTVIFNTDIGDADEVLVVASSRWCRFDRNREIINRTLSCVLYSNEGRNRI